jgi:hypothetical protein
MHRIFLLSPAHCGGERAKLLYRPEARFELAMQLRTPKGAMIGDVFSFLSGLYFRGKMAYSARFAKPPSGVCGQLVITTNRGLLPADTYVTGKELQRMGCVPIDTEDRRYRAPLRKSLKELRERASNAQFVLLGSVASGKYVDILLEVLGEKLMFPLDFVGRGDMSRGGLMLRCVSANRELEYAAVASSVLHGTRPPKLQKIPGIMSRFSPPSAVE